MAGVCWRNGYPLSPHSGLCASPCLTVLNFSPKPVQVQILSTKGQKLSVIQNGDYNSLSICIKRGDLLGIPTVWISFGE